jgi:hypothetical protein
MVTAIASDVRARPSFPKIVAQLSFRLTSPDKMIAAIKQLSGIVDGFYIAYPRNVGPACSYCSSANLDQVLVLLSHKFRHRVLEYLRDRKMWYLGLSFSGSGDRDGQRPE